MKDYLRGTIKPKNKHELIEGITTFWATVNEHKCSKYIGHLRKVISKVIEQGGGPTDSSHQDGFMLRLIMHVLGL